MSRFAITVFVASLSTAAFGQSLRFRTHELNGQSEFPACAVLDVNRDGRQDIVSGGWWYEAPRWEKRFLRDVEVIRDRFDDYSNLPLDINGDGLIDIISVNYRSRSLFWMQQPQTTDGTWEKHMIDTPGPMETGRLVDVDGDGRLDVLPNGTDFAAWWELESQPSAISKESRWVRHELPKQVAGHGIGFGDINRDGRGDIVGRDGWLEAPLDRRQGRWTWHADFELDRDCSVPILVHDVDQDGDADLIWGRGHQQGLYWLEQLTSTDGQPAWSRHAIDTSWSQAHSILLADLDADGRVELVAGKRYMGHEGKDLGEYDPLVIYWYSFDKSIRTWKRGIISTSARAGFGLDPKAADVDGDGDIDVVAGDRAGLFWFENLGLSKEAAMAVAVPKYPNHSELMRYLDDEGSLKAVVLPASWAIRRNHILRNMEEVMGSLPDPSRRVPLDTQVTDETTTDKYLRQTISFASEPNDRVSAYLLVPKRLKKATPAMVCLHQTTAIGKGEPAGLGGLKNLHYAHELAERGYICIVPDYPSFGDDAFDFRKQGAHYLSGSMKAIWNNIRAVDVLETIPEVDRDQIGVIGHSLGGHNALFTAAFDLRLKAVVTSCGFTAFHHYYGGNLAGWTSDRYMPRIRDVYGNDPEKVPFDFYEVLGAIAPRAIFVNAPLHDGNFENTGVKKVMATVGDVYKMLDSEDRLQGVYPDVGHDFPTEVRTQCYDRLDRWLKKD